METENKGTKQQQKRLKQVEEAMERRERERNGEKEPFYVITEQTSKESPELCELLRDIIWDERIGGEEDLSYEIVATACSELVNDFQFDEETDFYENECASVYTAERLSYLNNWNQEEISQKLREFGGDTDIATACAIWYDDMVRGVMERLKAYIMEE